MITGKIHSQYVVNNYQVRTISKIFVLNHNKISLREESLNQCPVKHKMT